MPREYWTGATSERIVRKGFHSICRWQASTMGAKILKSREFHVYLAYFYSSLLCLVLAGLHARATNILSLLFPSWTFKYSTSTSSKEQRAGSRRSRLRSGLRPMVLDCPRIVLIVFKRRTSNVESERSGRDDSAPRDGASHALTPLTF